jgi:hypothetical protein
MFTFEIEELACRITFDLNDQRQPDNFVVRNLDGATLPHDSPQYAPAVQWARALVNKLPGVPRFAPKPFAPKPFPQKEWQRFPFAGGVALADALAPILSRQLSPDAASGLYDLLQLGQPVAITALTGERYLLLRENDRSWIVRPERTRPSAAAGSLEN